MGGGGGGGGCSNVISSFKVILLYNIFTFFIRF